MQRRIVVGLVIALCLGFGHAGAETFYYRYPALAGDTVVFTAEGDLWSVPLSGGRASRLTTHPAEETYATASPDGKWVAFGATYDGPREVYVMPVTGGPPRRVSFEGRGTPMGWTPSGDVIYVTQNPTGPDRQWIAIAVDPATLKRHALPLADVDDAAVAPDGHTLYFTRFGLMASGDNVRSYHGGLASQLWRVDLAGAVEAQPIANDGGNDRRPMPWGDRVYFISDRGGRDNLWSMTSDGGDRRQLIQAGEYGIRTASLDHGRIVFQRGADLFLYDIAAGTERKLDIDLVSDFDQERRHLVKHPLDFFDRASFALDGERVAVVARGRIALMGVGPLRRVDVATPPEGRAVAATVSPDGKWVYAIVEDAGTATGDDPGAPEIWRFAADGSGDKKQLTHDDAGHRWGLFLSPDGKLLAHATTDGRLFLYDIDKDSNALIDTSPAADRDDIVWSADSRHLAFVRADSGVERAQLFLYEPATQTKQRLTTDRYEAHSPAFTPDGKWLYFLSERHFESSNPSPWGDRNMGPYFDRRTRVYALALQADLRFPFDPRDELAPPEPAKESDKSDDKSTGEKPAAGKEKKAEPLPVQWSGLADRLYQVPLAAGNYRDLAIDAKRLYVLDVFGNEGRGALKTLQIDNKDEKAQDFLGDVRQFALSGDRKKLFVRRWAAEYHAGDMYIVPAGVKAPDNIGKAPTEIGKVEHEFGRTSGEFAKMIDDLDKYLVRAGDWNVTIDPQMEWRQMFADAWRMHRDFFYEQNMHGADWLKLREKYRPLVERVTDRDELNDVLAQMMGELGTMHSQIVPGDLRTAQDGGQPGFLGAVLTAEPDGARIAHIYRSDAELPDERGPLARTGVDAREGDLIVAVNGRAVSDARDIAELLVGQAGQQVLLTLRRSEPPPKDAPKGTAPTEREVKAVVKAVNATQNGKLRYGDWEEGRRAAVEAAGGGRIGYLHLRAMAADDIAAFARDFYAQYDRDALIIDVRRNNGGNIDSWIIEKLLRRAWAVWRPRFGTQHFANMQQAFRGHLAVLVDESTYSDGEAFAAGIKALGLAPLIGERTAGAGVWLEDTNRLADRGMARVAMYPLFSLGSGQLLVENQGVEPDIAVPNLPRATFAGSDAQLDAAIRLLLDKLKSDPVPPL